MSQEWDVAQTRLDLSTRLKWFLGKLSSEVVPNVRRSRVSLPGDLFFALIVRVHEHPFQWTIIYPTFALWQRQNQYIGDSTINAGPWKPPQAMNDGI